MRKLQKEKSNNSILNLEIHTEIMKKILKKEKKNRLVICKILKDLYCEKLVIKS